MGSVSDVHELSRAAYDRLKAEFEDLTTRGRVDIARRIEAARELGDLSENGDYHAAKDEQGHMEGRIRQLEHIIEHAEVLGEHYHAEHGRAHEGCIVTVLFDGDSPDRAETYVLGHPEEQHRGIDVLTAASPLGSALIGATEGDVVTYKAPSGKDLSVRVVKVEHTE